MANLVISTALFLWLKNNYLLIYRVSHRSWSFLLNNGTKAIGQLCKWQKFLLSTTQSIFRSLRFKSWGWLLILKMLRYIKNILNYTFRSVMVFPNVKMQVTKNRKFALRSKFFFSSGWCILIWAQAKIFKSLSLG